MIDLVPAPAIAAALAGSFTIPACLVATQFTPLRPALGTRYRLSVTIGWGLWLAATLAAESGPGDAAAGAMIMATATMIAFNAWGLLAWGFMLSMLMALFRAKAPLSLDQWIERQNGGTIAVFAGNRLRVLLNMGLATEDGDRALVRSLKGRVMALVAVATAAWYGVDR